MSLNNITSAHLCAVIKLLTGSSLRTGVTQSQGKRAAWGVAYVTSYPVMTFIELWSQRGEREAGVHLLACMNGIPGSHSGWRHRSHILHFRSCWYGGVKEFHSNSGCSDTCRVLGSLRASKPAHWALLPPQQVPRVGRALRGCALGWPSWGTIMSCLILGGLLIREIKSILLYNENISFRLEEGKKGCPKRVLMLADSSGGKRGWCRWWWGSQQRTSPLWFAMLLMVNFPYSRNIRLL